MSFRDKDIAKLLLTVGVNIDKQSASAAALHWWEQFKVLKRQL